MLKHKIKLAILGATGAVGQEVLGCLKKLNISIDELVLLASERSGGTTMKTPFGKLNVRAVNENSFDGVNFAIFSAGAERSKQWAPVAIKAGCVVIDNSSAFRYQKDVPLVIPEINGERARGAKLIANPNCTTAIAAMALWPLHKKYKLKKIFVATYQATSGAGAQAMRELLDQTKNFLNDRPVRNSKFVYPIPFNLIPHIDVFQDNGYTKEEMKVAWEMKKMFGDDGMQISCTAVRIPTLRAHSEAIVIETEKSVNSDEARELLRTAPGIEVRDNPSQNLYPMPLTASGKYDVEVGRIRQSLIFGDRGLEFFVSGDQLLRGAALNAVKILQLLISQ